MNNIIEKFSKSFIFYLVMMAMMIINFWQFFATWNILSLVLGVIHIPYIILCIHYQNLKPIDVISRAIMFIVCMAVGNIMFDVFHLTEWYFMPLYPIAGILIAMGTHHVVKVIKVIQEIKTK